MPALTDANDKLDNRVLGFETPDAQFRVEFDYKLQAQLLQWTSSSGWQQVAIFDVEGGNCLQAVQDCLEYALTNPLTD